MNNTTDQKSKAIAVLYVQANGCYSDIPGVDAWDEARDARKYRGPHSVVAHPPCQPWVNLGTHNDGGCFARALKCVRAYGGVLEHPAGSYAWSKFAITPPKGGGWTPNFGHPNEWVCEVWQSAYGHQARKRTWLLYSGNAPPSLNWSRRPGTHGWVDRNKPTLSKKDASATTTAFRDALIGLAIGARGEAHAASASPRTYRSE